MNGREGLSVDVLDSCILNRGLVGAALRTCVMYNVKITCLVEFAKGMCCAKHAPRKRQNAILAGVDASGDASSKRSLEWIKE